MKRALLCLALALPAFADDFDERLKSAAQELASENPDIRAAGKEALAALGDEDAQRLVPLLDAEDIEVRISTAAVLAGRGIFRNPEQTEVGRDLIRRIGAGDTWETRRFLVREFLELGDPAVTLVANELAECRVEPVAESPIAVAPGTTVALRMKNTGPRAAWVDPGRFDVSSRWTPFGQRPDRCFGFGRYGCRFACGGTERRTPEQIFIDSLASLRRVEPGAAVLFRKFEITDPRAGRVEVLGNFVSGRRTEVDAAFGNIAVHMPGAEIAADAPRREVAILASVENPSFRARILSMEGTRSLQITALEDRDGAKKDENYENCWWAAVGDDGRFLGSGPLELHDDDRIKVDGDDAEAPVEASPSGDSVLLPWKTGDVRTFPLKAEIPAGTRNLWMGFDVDFEKEQVVAEPVAIPAK